MTDSPSESFSGSLFDHNIDKDHHHHHLVPQIPIEIVSVEGMARLEAALVAARLPFSVIPLIRSSHVRSIQSITVVSKRRFSGCSGPDIEDSGGVRLTQKKTRLADSFLHWFRKKGLVVTDITATAGDFWVRDCLFNLLEYWAREWCEKQIEFVLLHGKRKVRKAMKTGSSRHAKLEEEVVTRVKVDVKSIKDSWALKLLNFMIVINQLLFEGLTRELPLPLMT
ncbi:hypothetical protein M0R45_016600 [Rubus argutus]|uniref:Uncharacterized protein n=1 Tax=Rubus argutus TaxID=59490 RepID=A0AAW1XT20_RUBAR